MIVTVGIDVGSTYTKASVVADGFDVLARATVVTGFRLAAAAERAESEVIARAGLAQGDVAYVVSTGYGRYQVPFRDAQVTDLTAQATGTRRYFPGTRTVLDMGGQTMKASRLDDRGKVKSFRLNDKCAAGTGAFLEKTARYLGYASEEIGILAAASKEPVAISGVCAVFAESEVINHVSSGCAPGDILHGAIAALGDRAVQLLKRTGLEPEITLVGGIARFETMVRVLGEKLGLVVNIPPDELAQHTASIGAAIMAWKRVKKLREQGGFESRLGAGGQSRYESV